MNNLNEKLSLQEEQELEFQILLNVDAFCKSNNIKYSLYAGTMLGAIRHKGFIPWDDDIDILMTRENYNKFISTYKSNENYSLVNYSNNPDCTGILFSKIFDNNTDAEEPNTKKIPGEGVWLDIFPFDFVSDNKFKRKITAFHFMLISKIIYSRTTKHNSFAYKILKLLFFWKTNKSLYTSLDKYSKKVKPSNFVKDLTMINGRDFIRDKKFPASLFLEYAEVEFMNFKFPCLKQFKEVLTIEFGDYMTLPPINQRYSHSMEAYRKNKKNT